MLISVQNILGGQLSAIGGQHLEIELPLSKSESNRALMMAHYAGIQEFKDLEVPLSNSDDTVLLRKHLDTLDKYLQSPLSVDGCPLTLDCHNAGTVFRFLMTAVANLQFTIYNLQFAQAITPHIATLCIVFPITLLTGFWLQKYVTFTASRLNGWRQLSRYILIVAVNLAINYFGLKLCVDVLGWYPTPSKMLITLITVIISYLGQKHYTFRTEK